MSGVVYSGKLKSLGHILTFKILDNDTVKISESYTQKNSIKSKTTKVSIDEGIAIQTKYIKSGYSFT
tara:strand:+ start:38 stop:238 length:201 start_codon:yes stop_codon:yes gene_type:complete